VFRLLGEAELLAGREQTAAEAFRQYLELGGGDGGESEACTFVVEQALRSGAEAMAAQDNSRAAECFRLALSLDPQNALARMAVESLGATVPDSFWVSLPSAGPLGEPVRVPRQRAAALCAQRATEAAARGDWPAVTTYLETMVGAGSPSCVAASLARASAALTGLRSDVGSAVLQQARDHGRLAGFAGLRSAVATAGGRLYRAALLMPDDLRAYGRLNRALPAVTEAVSAYARDRVLVALGVASVGLDSLAPAGLSDLVLEASNGATVTPIASAPWPTLTDFLSGDLATEGELVTLPMADGQGRRLLGPDVTWLVLRGSVGGPSGGSLGFLWVFNAEVTPELLTQARLAPEPAAPTPSPALPAVVVRIPTYASGGRAVELPSEAAGDAIPAPAPAPALPEPPIAVIRGAESSTPRPIATLGPETARVSPARPASAWSEAPAAPNLSAGASEQEVYERLLPPLSRRTEVAGVPAVAIWFTEELIDSLLAVVGDPADQAELSQLRRAAQTHFVFLVSAPEPEGPGSLPFAARCTLTDLLANRRRGLSLTTVVPGAIGGSNKGGTYVCFSKLSRNKREMSVREANTFTLTVEIGRQVTPAVFTWRLPLGRD